MSSLIELMHTVLYDRVHDIPQCNISIDITLLYVLKYNIFYCSLQVLNDQSVGKKLILLPKRESGKTLRLQRNKTSLRGSSHLLYQPRKKNFTSMCASLRKQNSAGGQHSRVTMQKNCIYKPKCVSFHFKIVNSLLRSCFVVPGSLY